MRAIQEIFSSRDPEFISGRPIGRKLGAGKQANVYAYGENEVIKILQPHWRSTNLIGGDWQAQLQPRLGIQQRYLQSTLPDSRVETDVLDTGERIWFIVQEQLDEREMKKIKYVPWAEIAARTLPDLPGSPSVLSQLDSFTSGVLQMIAQTGHTPDLSGNNESLSSHFDLRRSENIWIHEKRGVVLLDVVNPGPYYVADNPIGKVYVAQMRNAVLNFRKRLGFDMDPIVAG